MAETIEIKRIGLTLELILHKRYGVRGRELLTPALELNPSVSFLDLQLPIGTVVVLPDLPAPAPTTQKMVTLFG